MINVLKVYLDVSQYQEQGDLEMRKEKKQLFEFKRDTPSMYCFFFIFRLEIPPGGHVIIIQLPIHLMSLGRYTLLDEYLSINRLSNLNDLLRLTYRSKIRTYQYWCNVFTLFLPFYSPTIFRKFL